MRTMFRIVVLCLLTIPADAFGADFGLNSVGVHGGLAAPEDFDAGVSLGFKLDIGTLADRLTLEPTASYWRASADELGVDVEATSLTAGVDVLYYFSELRRGFYAGGGLRLNRVEIESAFSLGPFGVLVVSAEDDKASPAGVVGFAGGRFYVEAGLNAIEDLATVSLALGVRFGG